MMSSAWADALAAHHRQHGQTIHMKTFLRQKVQGCIEHPSPARCPFGPWREPLNIFKHSQSRCIAHGTWQWRKGWIRTSRWLSRGNWVQPGQRSFPGLMKWDCCQCAMSWRSLKHPEFGRCGPALYKVSLLYRHYILSSSISCDCSLTQGTPKVFPITPSSALSPLPDNSPDPFE